MLESLAFGRLLYAGIIAYRSGDYPKSQSLFEKALLINPSDFSANFWMLRASALEGKLETALHYLGVCKKRPVAEKVENLLKPWESYCLYPTYDPAQIALLNSQTDELLEHYEHFREFRLSDIFKAFLLAYGPAIIAAILQDISIVARDISNVTMASIALLFSTPLVGSYYYRKAVLIPNIVVSFYYCICRVRRLFSSKIFIWTSFVILIGVLLFGNRSSGLALEVTESFGTIFSIIVFTPIVEEIVFRGVLYGYMKKYGENLAWMIVILMFYFSHGEAASFWIIIFSFLTLNVYDKERTILAPILVHSINNAPITLLVLLH